MVFDPKSAATFLAGGGVAAVTTFAPDALPEFWRLVGFWGGLSVMTIGLVWMCWLYVAPCIRMPRVSIEWGHSFSAAPSRIPLKDLLDMAQAEGWAFDGTSLHLLDLGHAMRQAGLDGTLKFWGRPRNSSFDRSVRMEPLNAIPNTHWADYKFDIVRLYATGDNFDGGSNTPSNDKRGYADIYVGGPKQAARWLKREAIKERGKRKP